MNQNMGRAKRKPDYDAERIQHEMIQIVQSLYCGEDAECSGEVKTLDENSGDRTENHDKSTVKMSLRAVADELNISMSKVIKLLITDGVYSSDMARAVNELYGSGKTVQEIQNELGVSRATVHSYLPYRKGIYSTNETSLTATWDIMYAEAKKYYKENGDLLPILSYETETGYALGRWISTQRVNRRKNDPSLTSEKIELLNEIGMNWESAEDRLWNTFYSAASDYYNENGNLDIPAEYVTEDGIKLGRLYRSFRAKYVSGGLSDEKKLLLEDIGMEKNSVLVRKWMTYYEEAKLFYEENGHLTVPHKYEVNDLRLGIWVSSQRESYQIGRLSEEQIHLLNDIGMSWDRYESKWENGFSYAKRFVEEYGDINSVPQGFCYGDFRLFVWVRMQRARKREGKLSDERIKKLESIGLYWDKSQAFWESGYAHTVEYLKEHGSLKMKPRYVCEDGFKLWTWITNQKTRLRKGTLPPDRVEKLKEIGL